MVAIYVHVPFCASRCRYCAFYSGEPLPRLRRYAELVVEETRLLPAPAGTASSVYFGGGTPSLLRPAEIGAILDHLDRAWGIDPNAEITLEVNPSSAADLRGFCVAGVNRLSVGVQALDEHLLRWLGRGHGPEEARQVVSAAARESFAHLSVDLLHGLPGLLPAKLGTWVRDLVARGADHVSTYSLEVHPRTALEVEWRAGRWSRPKATEEEAQERALGEALQEVGLRQYEVSNFARPGGESRHNIAYWDGSPYRGLGPGAHSYEPCEGPWGTRRWNERGLHLYEARLSAGKRPVGKEEHLSREEALLENLFLALRRTAPFDLRALCRRFDVDFGRGAAWLASLEARGHFGQLSQGVWEPRPATLRRADGIALWLHSRLLEGGGSPP